ncbi:MAG: magnesium chelatase subunit H [Deltaproteobacteria bacterium]|nr:magnesium chelatase subunit H [Nannocystaceae bacterium]
MTQKPTSKPERTEMVVVIITLDRHIAGVIGRVRELLAEEIPGLDLRFHALTSFADPHAIEACRRDIAEGDVILANMFFLEDHIRAVLPALEARQPHCDAMICTMSAAEIMRLTRMGDFTMSAKKGFSLLKKLRGKSGSGGKQGGAGQLAMLRLMPKLLTFIPGKAQDMRAYFLTMSYLLSGSTDNVADMVRLFVNQYASGPRIGLRGTLQPGAPRCYPEVGLYHPRMPARIGESLAELPEPARVRGTVGVLVMRSYVLAGDTRHYDRVIESLEARGYKVITAFACGLDNRPAIEKFFIEKNGRVRIDALLSLTGFSLVGGPAFNDAAAAEQMLVRLDVPYLTAQPLEFQSIEQWQSSASGLTPVEATIMVAIPELDGAIAPIVFGGRSGGSMNAMQGIGDRIERLTGRIDRMIELRTTPVERRNVSIVLFNFPPNGGATGTAAYLSVFQSLQHTLVAMKAEGYDVEVPESVEALRARVLEGNAAQFGTDANVLAKISADDHVRRTPHLAEIEQQWGAAPGKHQSYGSSVLVLGARFGRVVVGIQPTFGYEGDPMRLLFESGFAPTHAFAAFYRYLREDCGSHVVVHFGTHGALEFMPGKQVGLSNKCWPDRLLGDLPNVYLYASNNPSEGTIARRRSAATLVSYLTPPVARSGLYRDLETLRGTLDRLRSLAAHDPEAIDLVPHVQEQAVALELASAEPRWAGPHAPELAKLSVALIELEHTLVPYGLHVLGQPMPPAARADYLLAMSELDPAGALPSATIDALVAGKSAKAALIAGGARPTKETLAQCESLAEIERKLAEDHELPGLLRAMAGRFIRSAPGGDLLRTPEVLPTGRNIHGFDPFGIPSAFALRDGARQAELLVRKHVAEGHPYPRSIAIVLWGADNLKSGGGPIGQALALMGARPRNDSYGKLCGAELIDLAELGRPRIDVVMTLSGIFRDLLPMQVRLLAEAALLAAQADEPLEQNFVRAHALAYQAERGCDLETAALRVFGNAENAYGANVNQMIENGAWQQEDELGDVFAKRKCFAYQASGAAVSQRQLLGSILADVDLAYQNLESVELGVTTVDHYFDSLGGLARAARTGRANGAALPVYIGDQTGTHEHVRTLREQVALETRTRALNPKWSEEMLRHGAEGVRNIEASVTNTLGWSATTNHVDPWVYRELAKTYMLDEKMRDRLAELNPKASVKMARRLLEASERRYWQPDAATLAALEQAGDVLEDRLEGAVSRVA